MRYLLDTNIVSALVKNPAGPVTAHVRRVGELAICTSVIVAGELRFGAIRKDSARLSAQLEAVLAGIDVLPLESPVEEVYGSLRAQLERVGLPMGGNDLWISAHAVALGFTIVTDNEREFSRVPGLNLENWLRLPPA